MKPLKAEPHAEISVTRRFAASPERVFDAFLDPAKAGKFMFATASGRMVRAEIDARVGGKFVFVDRRDGEDVEHIGEYLEIDRPHHLVFTLSVPKYRPELDRVTVEIIPHDTGSELALTHEMRPMATVDRRSIEQGWRRILDGLAGTLAPARLFVERSIDVRAPAAKVWDVLTDPGLSRQWIEEWWPDVVLESDWKRGSPVLWKLAGGEVGARGSVVDIDPPRMLRFTFKVKDSPPYKAEELTYRLAERDGHTTLSVSVGDFGDTPEHELCYPGAAQAWDRSLPRIKALTEK